jgi:hypothetical protein
VTQNLYHVFSKVNSKAREPKINFITDVPNSQFMSLQEIWRMESNVLPKKEIVMKREREIYLM